MYGNVPREYRVPNHFRCNSIGFDLHYSNSHVDSIRAGYRIHAFSTKVPEVIARWNEMIILTFSSRILVDSRTFVFSMYNTGDEL